MKRVGKFFIIAGVFILGLVVGAGLMSTKMVLLADKFQVVGQAQRNPNVIGPLIDLGEFTVNLSGGGALKTEITLEGFDRSSTKVIQEKQAFLTDRTITVLSSKKISVVSQPEGRGKIKSELLSELNELCNNQIKDVLFTSFIYSW